MEAEARSNENHTNGPSRNRASLVTLTAIDLAVIAITSVEFNVAAIIVSLILIALYAAWW